MLVSKDNILDYIPQRPPVVMVDCLLESDDEKSISGFDITQENIFCENNVFAEPGLIENMAQTAALRAGYRARSQGEKVQVGFIGAIKKLNITQLPEVGSKIRTTVKPTHNFGDIVLVQAVIRLESHILAEAELSIFTRSEKETDEV